MEATQRNAFEHVFDRYRKALRVFFERRTACRSEAEDLVQDVFVRLVAQRDPAAIRNPEAFVFTVAANLIRDQYRSQRVRGTVFEDRDGADVADDSDIERAAGARQELKLAVAALERMPAATRTVFLLHRFEHLSYRAIADRLGLTINQVRGHVARAMTSLAEALESAPSHERGRPRRKEYEGSGG
jgi:RNA polymerase sigma-70 factor (ECF subfamily)